MTTAQLRNVGDEITLFIMLDDDGEWIGTLGPTKIVRSMPSMR